MIVCRRLIAYLAGFVALACSSTAEPRSGPAPLVSGEYIYGPCTATWLPATPPISRTVVDFVFAADGTGPTPEEIGAIEHAGGIVRYRFHVPVVRADIDVDAVPRVVGSSARFARTVPDTSARDVQLIVMLDHPLGESDINSVQALGGTVLRRYDAIHGYLTQINDAAVPLIRALPGVTGASFNTIGCIALSA